MIEIKDLLARVSNLVLKEELKKELIKDTISEVAGIPLDSKDIEIKGATVYLNIKPIYKNEIFIKREKIQNLLEQKLGTKSPKNLR